MTRSSTLRLKFVTSAPRKSEVRGLASDTQVSFVPMEAVSEHGELDLTRTRMIDDVVSGYTFFSDGDVLIAKITPCFENGKGALAEGLTNGIGFGTTELHVVRAGKHLLPKFLFYITLSHEFRKLGEGEMYGASGQKRIPESFIRDYRQPIPTLEQQARIVDFLDREAVRIDELISKNQQLIELLGEQRFAIVFRLTTKGCDALAYKSAGRNWIGEVPVPWTVCRTKYVAKLRTGHTPSREHPEYWVNCTIPWFSLADVWQVRDGRTEYLGDTTEKISELGLANSAAELLPAGTVIVSRTASVGFSGIMPVPMATTQDFVNWVCGPKIMPEYLLCVFRSMKNEFRRLTMGSTHQTIYMPDVAEFVTPLPSVEEQKVIVAAIRQETRKIDLLTDLLKTQIDRLREYRSALITAAVTGQIDLRNYRAQEVALCP